MGWIMQTDICISRAPMELKNEEIKENRMKLKKYWSNEILKCYTPRNQSTDRPTAGFQDLSYNIL